MSRVSAGMQGLQKLYRECYARSIDIDNVIMFNGRAALYRIVNIISKLTQGIACTRSMFAQARERFGCDFYCFEGVVLCFGRSGWVYTEHNTLFKNTSIDV